MENHWMIFIHCTRVRTTLSKQVVCTANGSKRIDDAIIFKFYRKVGQTPNHNVENFKYVVEWIYLCIDICAWIFNEMQWYETKNGLNNKKNACIPFAHEQTWTFYPSMRKRTHSQTKACAPFVIISNFIGLKSVMI